MSYRQQPPKPVGGFYPQTKVYSDGSHYIAIPHTERPYRPRRKTVDEVITIKEEPPVESELQENSAPAEQADALIGVASSEPLQASILNAEGKDQLLRKSNVNQVIRRTKKQLFEQLYKENLFLKRRERRTKIIEAMRPYFDDEERTVIYVDANLDRKRRNLIARRIRLTRKANLQNFNYFVTFT